MTEEPYLIRRPLVRRGSRLLIGAKKADIEALAKG
jgi:arsenate reductase-like glutaredoxin family protein